MKVNFKKIVLWLFVLIVWVGCFTYMGYIVGQHYGVDVATEQFEDDTTAYRVLRTQKAVENGITLIGLAGGIFLIVKIAKQFGLPKEKD